jgi:hypothetical protein
MEENLTCEFCNSTFSKKSNLLNHKKTAKFCLAIQGKENNDFVCKYCNKKLSHKNSLNLHLLNCSNKNELNLEKLEKDIEELKSELINKDKLLIEKDKEMLILQQEYEKKISILQKENEIYKGKLEKLEDTIAKIAAKPRTTNNTTNNQRYNQIIQNLSPITEENLSELPAKLEDRHISQGPQGYVMFAQENFKDKILCTDIARRKITFKDEKNNIITDINGKQFTYKLFKTIHGVRANLVEIKKSKAENNIEKTQTTIHYGAEDVAIGKFLNRQEESTFSNKFISELSSKFYIKNLPNQNFENKELDEIDENEIEYLVLSD